MEISIELDGRFADEELRSLHDWLQSEPEIRLNAHIKLSSKSLTDGQMGDTLDLITLFAASGLSLPGAVQTLLTWKSARHPKCSITLTVDGATVVIEGIDQRTAEEIVAQIVGQDVG